MSGQPQSGAVVFRHRGLKLVGVLSRPSGRRRKAPAVLFLHGFPGAERSVDVQRQLLELGVGSLELHFSGAWGSEGFYRFTSLVDQAQAGLRELARQDFVDPRRLGVYGFSMGGWTAVNLAGGVPAPALKAVCAVAPVGGPEMVGRHTRDFVRRACAPLRVRGEASLVRDFARAVTGGDPAKAAARMPCPLLLIHGQADDVVPADVSRRIYAAAAGERKLVLAAGAGHDFLDRRGWLTGLAARWLAAKLSG